MAIIQDIRIYRCAVENVTGVNPEGFYNPELCAVARRICMKLREKEFSMGAFHHLYVNLTTCLEEGIVEPAKREPDRYFPWYRYYDVGISQALYDSLEGRDCIRPVASLLEKVLKSQFNTPEFGEDMISECVSEAISQGENMLMKYKEKITSKNRAVIYLRYLDNGRYFPLLRVFDVNDNIILEKDLPESQTLDNYGQISLNAKTVTIKPRKNIRSEFYEQIVFELMREGPNGVIYSSGHNNGSACSEDSAICKESTVYNDR